MVLISPSTLANTNVEPKTFIPPKAVHLLPVLKTVIEHSFPDFVLPQYFAGLVEQESCITLTGYSCWNDKAQLKTSREEGDGLGQLTKAYSSKGNVRFDSLTSMVKEHPSELHELTWNNILIRPDLQLSAIVLMTRDNYKRLYEVKDPIERVWFSDSAYNSGLKSVEDSRRLCSLIKGCNPQKWFNNVALTCTLSQKLIYGRTPCSINRTHVSNIANIRMNKYKRFF